MTCLIRTRFQETCLPASSYFQVLWLHLYQPNTMFVQLFLCCQPKYRGYQHFLKHEAKLNSSRQPEPKGKWMKFPEGWVLAWVQRISWSRQLCREACCTTFPVRSSVCFPLCCAALFALLLHVVHPLFLSKRPWSKPTGMLSINGIKYKEIGY